MKYHVVTEKATKLEEFNSVEELTAKYPDDGSRREFSTHLMEELRGRPKLKDMCGPCWGGNADNGEPIIRYEDWPSYEILSR